MARGEGWWGFSQVICRELIVGVGQELAKRVGWESVEPAARELAIRV